MVSKEDMDLEQDQWETAVTVHSPVVRSSENGTSYTTYAVSLKSDNCCFAQPYSCVHRRYSEFAHLRNLLKWHHPNVEPAPLPPKKYFSRFSQTFINERIAGLQKFMQSIVEVPVYLSDKAVHLFLQSQCTMDEIDEQVSDGKPCPKSLSSISSDYSSDTSSDYGESLGSLSEQEDNTDSASLADVDEIASEATETWDSDDESSIPTICTNSVAGSEPQTPTVCSDPIPILQPYLRSSLLRARSASPRISSVTLNTETTDIVTRRVSFCAEVKVAVIRDQFWNIGTRPIRSCVW